MDTEAACPIASPSFWRIGAVLELFTGWINLRCEGFVQQREAQKIHRLPSSRRIAATVTAW
jgi:hypothetical protein